MILVVAGECEVDISAASSESRGFVIGYDAHVGVASR